MSWTAEFVRDEGINPNTDPPSRKTSGKLTLVHNAGEADELRVAAGRVDMAKTDLAVVTVKAADALAARDALAAEQAENDAYTAQVAVALNKSAVEAK